MSIVIITVSIWFYPCSPVGLQVLTSLLPSALWGYSRAEADESAGTSVDSATKTVGRHKTPGFIVLSLSNKFRYFFVRAATSRRNVVLRRPSRNRCLFFYSVPFNTGSLPAARTRPVHCFRAVRDVRTSHTRSI